MPKICCVCDRDGAAYKCPACKLFYCAVACYNTHKAGNCKPLEKPSTNIETEEDKSVKETTKYDFPTEDTVSLQKLQELKNNEEVKECLKNPHVRNIIQAILNDKNPTQAIALAMTEPIFVELADACLKVVEPTDDQGPC